MKIPQVFVRFTHGDRGAGEDHYAELCGDRLLVRRELPEGRVQWFIEAAHGGFEAIAPMTLVTVCALDGDSAIFTEATSKAFTFSWETEV